MPTNQDSIMLLARRVSYYIGWGEARVLTFLTSLLSFLSMKRPVTLVYSCLYWRKYSHDVPHDLVRYI